jgi:4-amino-4-deoxy-L-arabinose transferase-like glycosyltransferase
VFLTARAWYGERAAWIAASLAGLPGVCAFYEIVILQSALDTFLTAAALWCLTLALIDRPPPDRRHETRTWPAHSSDSKSSTARTSRSRLSVWS